MTDKKKDIIPGEIISKLANIILVAVGNVLVVIGDSLIQTGKENLNALQDKPGDILIEDTSDFIE